VILSHLTIGKPPSSYVRNLDSYNVGGNAGTTLLLFWQVASHENAASKSYSLSVDMARNPFVCNIPSRPRIVLHGSYFFTASTQGHSHATRNSERHYDARRRDFDILGSG
jgi:hypothetical protein